MFKGWTRGQLERMNQARRRKKRTSFGVRTVEITRGKNGFGFTISGQAPCILSCIVAGSPAERAGLRPGDFLIAANGLNISKVPHDDVVRLIGNSSGVLKLQIAENYYSDSSDEEPVAVCKPKYPYRSRHRHHVYRAEKVVRDLWTGALFVDQECPARLQACRSNKKQVLSHCLKEATVVSPRISERTATVECRFAKEAAAEGGGDGALLRAVVGYLGTIEMPKEPQMPGSRLRSIGNCIRRLRIEKKVHTLVLLSVFADGLLLTDPHGAALAKFPAEKITFSGAYADDRKFFGLVTGHEEPVGSSCHVFLVDPKLQPHRMHTRQARAFRVACSGGTEKCREFPDSADVVLGAIVGLYRSRPNATLEQEFDAGTPPPSNTSSNSSNSDSGIGFKDEGNSSDRVIIVDVENYHRFRTNSLDRQNFGISSPTLRCSSSRCADDSTLDGRRDRLTVRAMPDPVRFQIPERSVPDKLSPKVFQEVAVVRATARTEEATLRRMDNDAAKKWARTASLRRHLPGRKRSVRKAVEAADEGGTMSDGELGSSAGDLASMTASIISERPVDVGRVGSWAAGFARLLEDSAGLQTFSQFLKQEFSQENIGFWIACEQYRQLTDPDQMDSRAREIFGRHLGVGAPEPVNVDSRARQVAQEGLGRPDHSIFLLAQKQIFNLMKFDCYQRFLKSQLYKGCMLREMQGQQPLLWLGEGGEEEDRKRKSLLPWARGRSSKSASALVGGRGNNKTSLEVGRSSIRRMSSKKMKKKDSLSGTNSLESLDSAAAETTTFPTGGLCRATLPDQSTTVLRTWAGESVGEMLRRLIERRSLPYTAVDAFQAGSHKAVDPRRDVLSLGCKELRLERRVLFRLDLPSELGVLGVKASPDQPCGEMLRSLLSRFELRPEQAVVHLESSPVPLAPSAPVHTLDGHRLTLHTLQGFQDWVERDHPPPAVDALTGELFNRLLEGRADFRLHNLQVVHLQEVDASGKICQQEKNDQNREDLLDIWKRAQRSRLDDQRGTEINFELPEFLRVGDKENRPSNRQDPPPVSRRPASVPQLPRPDSKEACRYPPPPLPPKTKTRGPPPRPPSRQPFCISFV